MPKGVPISTMGIGFHGAVNAALSAVRILALSDKRLAEKHREYMRRLEAEAGK